MIWLFRLLLITFMLKMLKDVVFSQEIEGFYNGVSALSVSISVCVCTLDVVFVCSGIAIFLE